MRRKVKAIRIGKKVVGYGKPIFVIAEAGVNHNGKLNLALKLIDAAAYAGADAVKFQTWKAEEVVIPSVAKAGYQKKNTTRDESQLEMLKKLELHEKFYRPIIRHCRKRNIIFLSTPHGGFESIDFLSRLNIAAFKFGSGDLNNFPILEYAARLGKPMVISTGMATLKEVQETVRRIRRAGNKKIIVLHCTTNYPTPFEEVNLRAMQTLMENLPVLVGYSDHTLGVQAPIMASMLGARVIEKHLTLNKKMPGPDHKASAEPNEFKEMVDAIRNIKTILGSAVKKPTQSEKAIMPVVRKSLVSLRAIKKGEKFSRKNVGIKRPGTGIEPKYFSYLVGSPRADRDIIKDSLINWKDVK